MKKRYELQSNALKNAYDIYRKNNGNVSWSQCCKFGWELAKKGKVLRQEKPKLSAEFVYKEYKQQVFSYVFKMVFNNRELAEDITADTFVKVCANLNKYDSTKSKLNTWIITIAKNIIIDRSRTKAEKVNGNSESIDGFVDDNGNDLYQIDGNVQTPEDVAENKELGKKIKCALSELDDKYREAATMFLVDGMKQTEIAEILQLPLNTVKAHIFRAKVMLQESLKGVY